MTNTTNKLDDKTQTQRFTRAPFLAAPTFLALYGVARLMDGLDGEYGPGVAWTFGHIMFLCGMISFGLVIVELRRRLGGGTPKRKFISGLAVGAGLVGILVFVRVIAIDILTGLRAGNHAAMSSISSQLNAYPIASLEPYYKIGPLLFQLGILTLMIQLAISRRLPWWSPALLFLGFLLLGSNLNLLLPGSILIGCALMPLAFTKNKR